MSSAATGVDILGQLGEIEEFGGGPRVILPESYYPVELTMDEFGVSKLSDDRVLEPPLVDEKGQPVVDGEGNQLELAAGGSPFLKLNAKVIEGPFAEVEGANFDFRQSVTPGKGGFIGFVNSAVKAVTGQAPNRQALTKYNFNFLQQADAKVVQQLFRTQFYLLQPDERKDFMAIWTNASQWDGKKCVIKVTHEVNTRVNEVTGEEFTVTYHRVGGYYPINHPKKGLAWVRKTCFPAQQRELDAMTADG